MLRSSPLFQLYLVRLRDFYRQPARVFWVYGFPTLLAIALGFAFQNRPPAPILVDLVEGPGSSRIKAALEAHNAALEREQDGRQAAAERPADRDPRGARGRGLEAAEDRQDAAGHRAARLGVVGLSLRPDPARCQPPPGRSIDDILQRAAGRKDPRPTEDVYVSEPGSRYIDFLIPGLIGLNAMGGGLWGIGFLLVNFRIAKLLKRFVATPMPRRDFLLALLGARLDVRDPRPGRAPPAGHPDVPHADPRQPGPGRR